MGMNWKEQLCLQMRDLRIDKDIISDTIKDFVRDYNHFCVVHDVVCQRAISDGCNYIVVGDRYKIKISYIYNEGEEVSFSLINIEKETLCANWILLSIEKGLFVVKRFGNNSNKGEVICKSNQVNCLLIDMIFNHLFLLNGLIAETEFI